MGRSIMRLEIGHIITDYLGITWSVMAIVEDYAYVQRHSTQGDEDSMIEIDSLVRLKKGPQNEWFEGMDCLLDSETETAR